MKILKLLNKKSLSIFFVLLVIFSTNLRSEDEPVDIWEQKENQSDQSSESSEEENLTIESPILSDDVNKITIKIIQFSHFAGQLQLSPTLRPLDQIKKKFPTLHTLEPSCSDGCSRRFSVSHPTGFAFRDPPGYEPGIDRKRTWISKFTVALFISRAKYFRLGFFREARLRDSRSGDQPGASPGDRSR